MRAAAVELREVRIRGYQDSDSARRPDSDSQRPVSLCPFPHAHERRDAPSRACSVRGGAVFAPGMRMSRMGAAATALRTMSAAAGKPLARPGGIAVGRAVARQVQLASSYDPEIPSQLPISASLPCSHIRP